MYLGYRAILFFALLFVALTAMNALAQPEPRVISILHHTSTSHHPLGGGAAVESLDTSHRCTQKTNAPVKSHVTPSNMF